MRKGKREKRFDPRCELGRGVGRRETLFSLEVDRDGRIASERTVGCYIMNPATLGDLGETCFLEPLFCGFFKNALCFPPTLRKGRSSKRNCLHTDELLH